MSEREPGLRPRLAARLASILLALLTALVGRLAADEPVPTVASVAVEGNLRVEQDAIKVQLRTQPGIPYDAAALDADIRAVYGMGFFDQVDADVSPAGAGQVAVVFRVKERPLVRTLKVEGTDEIEKEEIEGALKVRPRTILDPEKIRQGIEAARKLYIDKGYLDATITYTTTVVGENEVDIVYKVDEKDPIKVEEVDFEGNEAFSGRTLRGVMQTRESWIFGFLTGAGVLSRDVLRTDVERLTAYYYDHGYVTVRIDEPRVERKDDGLYITVKIAEGEQFKIGNVALAGTELPPDTTKLQEGLDTVGGEVFSASALREDSQKLTERLSEDGYAFATVEPQTAIDEGAKTVDVLFQADRGKQVVVDRIEIEGNSKTRDKVIRREMRLQEQELFSARKLRKSREALQRLGFFQEVNITTRRAAAEDRMNVVVAVKEAQTGAFSAGAGFSSADALLFNVRIQENNLFGRGHRVVANADVGSIRRNIVLSFTEPYFRDTPLTVGVDVFDWRLEFDDFARSGRGAGTQVTYPVTALGYDTLWGLPLDDVRVGADYRIERAEIGDIDFSASRSIRAESGTSLVSSITPRISRNTLNHAFDPTAGSFQDLGVELAGLGGEQFVKVEARERWYYTFLRSKALGDFTYSIGAALGYGFGDAGLNGDELPLFERYFPGGINSIRGFETRTLGPREVRKNIFGQVVDTTPIGGSQQVIINNEIIFPLVQGIGLKGVLFVDAGNAYSAEDGISIDETRVAGGAGIRWLSPLGPFRIELGKPLVSEKFDEESLVLFSFGGPFQY